MKIALVSPTLSQFTGGVGKIVGEYAKHLSDDFGHDVTIFTHKGDVPLDFSHENVRVLQFPTVTIKVPYTISHGMMNALLKERFDVIHSHHYGYAPATVGFLASKIRRTPHVFSTYYQPPMYGVPQRALFSTYYLTQGFPLLRFSDSVITMTNFEERMMKRIGAANTKVVPGFVDTDKFRQIRKIRKRKMVLFVSRLSSHKGADVAFRLAEQMTAERGDVEFVFIGSKPTEPRLLSQYEALKKNRRIKFLSNLPEGELARWFNAASVFILPSKYEAFGLVLAEAQACGTPVVSTTAGGVPDVVKTGETGFLVEYGDWAHMKEKVELLLDDAKLNKKMGTAGRKHVTENFEVSTVVKKLAKIYEEVL